MIFWECNLQVLNNLTQNKTVLCFRVAYVPHPVSSKTWPETQSFQLSQESSRLYYPILSQTLSACKVLFIVPTHTSWFWILLFKWVFKKIESWLYIIENKTVINDNEVLIELVTESWWERLMLICGRGRTFCRCSPILSIGSTILSLGMLVTLKSALWIKTL